MRGNVIKFSSGTILPVNGTFDSGFSVSIYLFNSRMNYEPSKENTTNQVILLLFKGNVIRERKKFPESGIVVKRLIRI